MAAPRPLPATPPGLLDDEDPGKWERVKQALWETNLNAPVRGFYNMMNADPYTLYTDTGQAGQQAALDSADAAGGVTAGSAMIPKPRNALMMGIKSRAQDALLTKQTGPEQSVGILGGAELAGKSNSIHSIDDIRNLLSEGKNVFVRWSAGPKYDMAPGAKSKDFVSGQTHDGLSAVELTKDMSDQEIFAMVRDYSFLRGENADAPYFYHGKSVGRDSDGAPSIVPTEHLGSGSSHLQSFLDDDLNLERISLLGQEKNALAALNDPNYGKGPWIPAWKPQDLEKIQNRLSEIGREHPSKEGRK